MTGFSRFAIAGALAAASLLATQAMADSAPTLLGAYKGWSALQSVSGDGRACYVMAQPKSSEPRKAKRDPIYFLINNWPARRAKDEVEIVSGYQFRDGSTPTIQVGAEKFELFTKNDGSGAAWMKDTGDEQRLVAAMSRSATAVVTGTSMRGTVTHDTYALAGLGAALDKAHSSCGM